MLREHVSVKDFGAQGNCSVAGSACDCADATAAFEAALAASGGVVHVWAPEFGGRKWVLRV